RQWIDLLYPGPRPRRVPPVVEEDAAPRMLGGPLLREGLHGTVAAVAIDDQDAAKSGVDEAVEDVADEAQVRLDAQGYRAGVGGEVRRDAVRDDREYRHAERFGGLDSHAFGEDAVDRQPEIRVLLRAPERQHRAIVALQVLFHLHPVHVADSHVQLQS